MAKDKYGISGTPWHIENIHMAGNDDRRHRSRCAYFQKAKSQCSIKNERCIGSSHCSAYREVEPEIERSYVAPPSFEKKKQRSGMENCLTVSKGDYVVSAKYGRGLVTDVFRNGNIKVDFLDGTDEKVFFQEALLDGRIQKSPQSGPSNVTLQNEKSNINAVSKASKENVSKSNKTPSIVYLLGKWETVSSKTVEATIAVSKIFDNTAIRVENQCSKVLFWTELLKNKTIVISLHNKEYRCIVRQPKDANSDFSIQPDTSFWQQVKHLCKAHDMITVSFTYIYKGVYKSRLIICDE